MKKLLFILALLLPSIIYAQNIPPRPPAEVICVVQPSARLTSHWIFVVDTSHSIQGCFEKSQAAFVEATHYPTDQLKFQLITFNNEWNDEVIRIGNGDFSRHWTDASPLNFSIARKLTREHCGIRSFGARAMERALVEPTRALTIILITDGGFSEGFNEVRKAINAGEKWRLDHGLDNAIITTMGVENIFYRGGHKQPDIDCQAFLRDIGETWHGGYFLARGAID